MPPWEDDDNVCVEYPVEGEALIMMRALNMHVKWMIQKVRGRIYSTWDVMFIIRYVT
jgi:hypothetical protein